MSDVLNRGLLCVLAVAAAAAMPAPAAARDHWTLASPDGRLTADVRASAGAPLQATVRRDGEPVLSTRIGLAAGALCLPQGFARSGQTASRIVEDYLTPAGKRRTHRLAASELVLRFRRDGSKLRVQLRAADDGFAYRTAMTGPARARVTGECSAFTAPAGTQAWMQRFTAAYEGPYVPGPLRGAAPGPIGYPVLLEGAGTWTLLSESALDRGQPATHLEVRAGVPDVLSVVRPHVGSGLKRLRTPWRVAVVGSLSTVVASDLVDDLAPPARARDWSWVRPGRVAWSWWSDSGSPASLTRQKQYVDFAARMGWEYVTVDAGWDPAWIPELTAYASRRRVGVLLWSRWDALATAAQRDVLLPRWRAWGVAGVKLDFMQSDSEARMRWYRAVARAAARQRLVVNFHGSTVPRGLSRTWPNVLTMEGVVGAETYKGQIPVQATPSQNATLPFTRNVIGSMDYTPVTFSTPLRQTTAAHELALSVVFESGLQHFADSPEAYDAHPLAERWLRGVPAAWDDTRLLDGYPGTSATLARRAGKRWFVGAIRADAGGVVDLPLDFLPRGREYVAWTIEDWPTGGLVTRTRRVTAEDALRLTVDTAGGYVARFTPVG